MAPRSQIRSRRLAFSHPDDVGGSPAPLERRGDRLVLCYHALSESWPAGLAVKPERFEQQVAELLEEGYQPTTFHDAVFGDRAGSLLAITFDDGFDSVFRLARPILDRLDAPATVFVATEYTVEKRPVSWPGVDDWIGGEYERELEPMSWGQVAELAAAGWEVGSHTVTHARLPELGDEQLDLELSRSRREIEDALGRPCASISYPYGAHDERVLAAARRAGYSAGCTLPHRLHTATPLRWPRVGIYNGDEIRRFRFKTSRLLRTVRSSVVWNAIDALRGPGSEPRQS